MMSVNKKIFEPLALRLPYPIVLNMIRKVNFLVCLTAFPIVTMGTSLPDSLSTADSLLLLKDDAYAAQLDSAIHCYYEELIALSQDLYSIDDLAMEGSNPTFTAEEYATRLELLDKTTPFDLTYNSTVEAFIHLYVSKKRSLSAHCLGQSDYYFPLFEETLDKHNLPLELKYLAVVESGLNPTVKSRAGATGLWQFMYGTGKHFGLAINSYVDERCDPIKSTEAACKYLAYLYDMFGDWDLALAAYNCGEGRVTKAIRKSGGKNTYWEIYPYLPKETRGYVPAFIAVNYLFAYAKEHAIVPVPAELPSYAVDSIHLNQATSFAQIATILEMDEELVANLNPIYRAKVIPGYGDYNVLYLPKDKLGLWVNNISAIETRLDEESVKPEVAPVVVEPQVIYYTVRSGDYLGKIAERNSCSVRQIQQWNNMSGTSLRVGQKLVLHANSVQPQKPSTPTPAVIEKSGNNIYYSVRSGDTLWDIAKDRGVSLEDLKRWNAGVNFNNMKPGQKLIIGKG
jgi:membrane-bound lytic murein transglycosylase D